MKSSLIASLHVRNEDCSTENILRISQTSYRVIARLFFFVYCCSYIYALNNNSQDSNENSKRNVSNQMANYNSNTSSK